MKNLFFVLTIFVLIFGCTNTSICGDGICESKENQNSCLIDCEFNNEEIEGQNLGMVDDQNSVLIEDKNDDLLDDNNIDIIDVNNLSKNLERKNSVLNKDCEIIWDNRTWFGEHGKVGMMGTNTDGGTYIDDRFMCYNNLFYECGWERDDSSLAIKINDGEIAGNLICETKSPGSGEWKYGDYKFFINQNDLQRYYLLHVPKNYDSGKEYPLVFVFHGGGSNASSIKESVGYDDLSEIENFIVVYPQGIDNSSSREAGTWNAGPYTGGHAFEQGINDVEFFDLILEDIKDKFKVDSSRVYSTGISMGGMFSYRLACERTDKIAAIAPIASNLALDYNDCNPSTEIPIIHFHGTLDKFVPINGGDSDPSLPDILVVGGPYHALETTMNFFKENNSCSGEETTVYENGDSTCNEFSCNNSKITKCIIDGGGHTWPGTSEKILLRRTLGKTSRDILATNQSWEFFKQFSN